MNDQTQMTPEQQLMQAAYERVGRTMAETYGEDAAKAALDGAGKAGYKGLALQEDVVALPAKQVAQKIFDTGATDQDWHAHRLAQKAKSTGRPWSPPRGR